MLFNLAIRSNPNLQNTTYTIISTKIKIKYLQIYYQTPKIAQNINPILFSKIKVTKNNINFVKLLQSHYLLKSLKINVFRNSIKSFFQSNSPVSKKTLQSPQILDFVPHDLILIQFDNRSSLDINYYLFELILLNKLLTNSFIFAYF